jgi:hypothetical protein
MQSSPPVFSGDPNARVQQRELRAVMDGPNDPAPRDVLEGVSRRRASGCPGPRSSPRCPAVRPACP